MSERPLIGVLPLYDTKKQSIWMLPGYLNGIIKEGGTPFILPYTDDKEILDSLCSMCSGFLLTGGQDINPDLYKEEKNSTCGEVLPVLDSLFSTVLDYAVKKDIPVLGICRGLQFLNVYFGGTLFQDLKTQTSHNIEHHQKKPYSKSHHGVFLVEGKYLKRLLGKDSINVNSIHHQAVKDVGDGLEVLAVSEDGIIEALRAKEKRYMVGVQWHPEYNYLTDENSQLIFRSFVQASKFTV